MTLSVSQNYLHNDELMTLNGLENIKYLHRQNDTDLETHLANMNGLDKIEILLKSH